MDLTKAFLPDSIVVSGRCYQIKTGHPYWFRFAQLISEKCLVTDFDHLYTYDIPEDRQAGIDELVKFFSEKKELPRGESSGYPVLDYDLDSELIYSGILQCYGLDLYEKEYHWHKVRAMITGLTGSRLNDIIGYRLYTGQDKDLIKLKQKWALPEKMTAEEKKIKDRFDAQLEV